MSEADLEAINAKIEAGEELTEAEQEAVMGAPAENEPQASNAGDDDQVNLDDKTGIKKESEADEKEDDKAEDTPSDDDDKAGKSKEKDPDATEDDDADDDGLSDERKNQIKEEAEKPLSEANLDDFNDRERALFVDLRKERRKRQEAQRERDVLKFQNLKKELKDEIVSETQAEKEDEDPLDGLDDDDVLTVAELREKLKQSESAKAKAKAEDESNVNVAGVQRLQLQNWMLEARIEHADAIQVTDLAEELLEGDKDAEAEIALAIKEGRNPVLVTYNLVKSHPSFKKLAPKAGEKKGAKGEDDKEINRERKERIEKNSKKVTTTGSGGGAAGGGEYTVQEIVEMDDDDYAKLSPAQREKILAKF